MCMRTCGPKLTAVRPNPASPAAIRGGKDPDGGAARRGLKPRLSGTLQNLTQRPTAPTSSSCAADTAHPPIPWGSR